MGYVERVLNNDINNSNINKIAKTTILCIFNFMKKSFYEEFYKHRF